MSSTPTDVGTAHVRFTSGFWQGIQQKVLGTTVPAMGADLADDTVSPALRNFRIAVGDEQGEHAGPPFLDGDFYKWLEAALAVIELEPTSPLRGQVDEAVSLIARSQRADGYVHTPTVIAERKSEEALPLADRFNFETYNLGHLISAAVRHHAVTGETSFLEVAEGAAGWLEALARDKPLDLARSAICPSHYMAVVELYRATGAERWLRLAEAFIEVRDDFQGGDDNQDRIPVREQRVAAGHAVRANYLYAGLADLVLETGDESLMTVLESVWSDVVDTKLALTGGCGALYDGASPDGYPWQSAITRVHQAYGRAYQLPHTTAHNETCANIGMLLWSERMLALTGEAKYADVVERIAHNTLLAGMSLAGTEYFYTNPLRQVRELPFPLRMPGDTVLRPTPEPPPSDARLRERYLSCFCCPPNLARTLARWHERGARLTPQGLRVDLYGGTTSDIALPDGGRFVLREESDYPWSGHIEFHVDHASGAGTALPLMLRVPGWAVGATVSVAGSAAEAVDAGTYVRIERTWSAGESIVLELPMPVRLLRAHRLVEEASNQIAVQRGPLVYALESHDLPSDVRLEQVALPRDARLEPHDSEVAGHRVVELRGDAAVLPADTGMLYSELGDEPLRSIPLRLIPYYAWSNRGPGEMSVWLPVVWS